MLFSRSISELKTADVEEFCSRFREGLRVEYKSTFDANVKNKIPRVISSFANSYGGILVIGVNAQNGTPQEPFDGIQFEDREPRLTVENICRTNIFPEVLIYQNLVPSRVTGRSFLVIQVNESPKAPHAIENSTQVYVRSGDSANPTKIADMQMLERLIRRRRDVLQRWDAFFTESLALADAISVFSTVALLEMRIGPLYPTDVLISREKVFSFLADSNVWSPLRFGHEDVRRNPSGGFLVRLEKRPAFLNVSEIGAIHYLEPLYFYQSQTWGRAVIDFWSLQNPLRNVISTSAKLFRDHGVTCDLRIEAALKNIARAPFVLSQSDPFNPLLASPAFQSSPALVNSSSENLEHSLPTLLVELLYQLRWPLGRGYPQTREEISAVVNPKLV
jgi:hypothetical protein